MVGYNGKKPFDKALSLKVSEAIAVAVAGQAKDDDEVKMVACTLKSWADMMAIEDPRVVGIVKGTVKYT